MFGAPLQQTSFQVFSCEEAFHCEAANTTTTTYRTTTARSEGGGSHRTPQRAVATEDGTLRPASGGPPVIERGLRPQARVPVDELPNYAAVEVDNDGNAILPRNFLPNIVDNLPDEWYYRIYPYYPYFDRLQRDTRGRVIIKSNVVDPLAHIVIKWINNIGFDDYSPTSISL